MDWSRIIDTIKRGIWTSHSPWIHSQKLSWSLILFLYGLVVRKPFTKVHQSLHFLAMLGKVDIKVGWTGKCQKKVTDVGQTTQPRRPGYCIRMIVLENFRNILINFFIYSDDRNFGCCVTKTIQKLCNFGSFLWHG